MAKCMNKLTPNLIEYDMVKELTQSCAEVHTHMGIRWEAR